MEDKDHNARIVAEFVFVSTTSKRSRCLFCGRSQISEHNKIKSGCKGCGGSQICEHKKQTSICPTCDPLGQLAGVVWRRVYIALKSDKEMSSTEYLGCNIETFKQHIEQQFTEDMSWENYGEWYIDHKIPLKYHKPSLEEVAQRLNYTNTQPMWTSENMSKGCRYISGWSKWSAWVNLQTLLKPASNKKVQAISKNPIQAYSLPKRAVERSTLF